MHVLTKRTNINTNVTKTMHDDMFPVKLYKRDKNGNRGELITTKYYPSKEAAQTARKAIIWLCVNQWKFPKEWSLKNVIVV